MRPALKEKYHNWTNLYTRNEAVFQKTVEYCIRWARRNPKPPEVHSA
jgi:hypothetical protein